MRIFTHELNKSAEPLYIWIAIGSIEHEKIKIPMLIKKIMKLVKTYGLDACPVSLKFTTWYPTTPKFGIGTCVICE